MMKRRLPVWPKVNELKNEDQLGSPVASPDSGERLVEPGQPSTRSTPPVPDAARSNAAAAEANVIRLICGGSSDLFVELVRPYQKMVYSTAISIVRNEQDAEDVAQEALFKAFKNLRQFRGDCKFSTWLIQITMNEARQRLRKKKRNAEESLDAGSDDEGSAYSPIDMADWREIPSEALHRKELQQALTHALSQLKPIYRDVFTLRDIQQFSVAETAIALTISEASVKTRLLRARHQMRDALAPGFDGSWNTGSTTYKRVRPF